MSVYLKVTRWKQSLEKIFKNCFCILNIIFFVNETKFLKNFLVFIFVGLNVLKINYILNENL